MPNAQKRKRLLFRAFAIFAGVLPLVVLELALRVFGIGSDATIDPLSGFNSRIPLFERQGAYYRTAKAREPFVGAQQFPADKSANAFRIFCFGGSTVYGHPYLSDTAFPKWLDLELSARVASRTFEVINAGGVSYASYRIAPLVKEVLNYQPDLIIVATGENEFLEDRTYRSLKNRSPLHRWTEDRLQSLRIVSVMRDWLHQRSPKSTGPSGNVEIQTRLDSPAGYASYHRDDRWHDQVAEQFADSLRDISQTCQRGHVPLFLIKLGCNLRDCPPYKSEHRSELSSNDEQSWQRYFDAATAHEKSDPQKAITEYREAEKIDPEYALLLFRIGRLLDTQGEKAKALQYYIRARDEDVCPLRMPTRHEEILSRVATENMIPLIDAAGTITRLSMDQIPGNDWYLDHVHPNIGGHQLIARALAERAISLPAHSAANPWPDTQRRIVYTRHMQSLPKSYLAEGLKRVEWLEHWARREKLYDESLPRDGAALVRAGFRQLEIADYETAQKEITQGVKMNSVLNSVVEREAALLADQGRPNTADMVLSWLK